MQQQKLEFIVEADSPGARLDKCLADLMPDHSRAWIQKRIKDGAVAINGVPCLNQRTVATPGMTLTIDVSENAPPPLSGEDIQLPILFEDDAIIVIDKPAGMVVHPAAGNWSGTVVNALIGRDDDFGADMDDEHMRPGIVHRLDKDTSGCLVIAKTRHAQLQLTRAFAERLTSKTYAAIVSGIPKYYNEAIDLPIGRHPVNRKKMAVVERNGKEAHSEYELLDYGRIDDIHPASLLSVKITTGRTHQIRVHLAYKKIPVLGDKLYGGNQKFEAPRQMLHAWKLKIPHPESGHVMSFKSPWPEDFQSIVDRIQPYPEEFYT